MSDESDPRTEYQRRLDELNEGLLEAFEAGYRTALTDVSERDTVPAPEAVAGSEYLAQCSFYYWDGRIKPLERWLEATLIDDEDADIVYDPDEDADIVYDPDEDADLTVE